MELELNERQKTNFENYDIRSRLGAGKVLPPRRGEGRLCPPVQPQLLAAEPQVGGNFQQADLRSRLENNLAASHRSLAREAATKEQGDPDKRGGGAPLTRI